MIGSSLLFMGVLIKVVDPRCVEKRASSFDAVNLVAFFEQEFRQIGPILTGNSGD